MFFDTPPVDRAGLERWIAERFADVPFIAGGALASWLADRTRTAARRRRRPVAEGARRQHDPRRHRRRQRRSRPQAVATLDPAAPIVVYCAGGLRSAKAARVLIEAGHTDVRNLEGGIFAWANDDRPLACGGRPTRYAHPCDDKWGALLARDRHALAPPAA